MAASPSSSNLWSQLDVDLLHAVFDLLISDFSDMLSCASVCNQWRQAAASFLSQHSKTGMPLILLKHQGRNPYRLLDIETAKLITLELLELQGTWFSGCSYGWLLTVDCQSPHSIHLLNPITRARIRLPQILKSAEELRGLRVVTSTNPCDKDCSVLAAYPYENSLQLWKKGDLTWTTISCDNARFIEMGRSLVDDAIFFKGKFYVAGRDDFLYEINPNPSQEKKRKENPNPPRRMLKRVKRIQGTRSTRTCRFRYLVESEGDLFLAIRCTEQATLCGKHFEYATKRVLTYKFVVDGKRKSWVPMKYWDMNAVLFLGRLSSTSSSIDTGQSDACNGDPLKQKKDAFNCVYCIDDACDDGDRKDNCVFTRPARCLKSKFSEKVRREISNTRLDWFKSF